MEKDIVVDLVVLLLPRSTRDAAALLPTTICEFPPHLLAGAGSPAALALVVTVHSSALGLSTGARTPLLLLHLLFLLHRKWAVVGELVVLLALAGVDVEVPPWFWSEVLHADVGVLGGRRRRGAVDGEGCKGTAGILGAILYLANVRVYGGGRGDRAGVEFDCDGDGIGARKRGKPPGKASARGLGRGPWWGEWPAGRGTDCERGWSGSSSAVRCAVGMHKRACNDMQRFLRLGCSCQETFLFLEPFLGGGIN